MDLQQISDILEIQGVLARYAYALDAKDWDALDDVFTADASFDYAATGGEIGDWGKIKPWLIKALGNFPHSQHLIGLPQINLAGDSATSATMLFNPMTFAGPDGPALFFCGATYRDDWRRTDAGWRISRRVETDSWFKDLPASLVPAKAD
ncbi:MAG: nuclear transport factor 2 family protein [Polymorphobacter sp.]